MLFGRWSVESSGAIPGVMYEHWLMIRSRSRVIDDPPMFLHPLYGPFGCFGMTIEKEHNSLIMQSV